MKKLNTIRNFLPVEVFYYYTEHEAPNQDEITIAEVLIDGNLYHGNTEEFESEIRDKEAGVDYKFGNK